MESDRRLRRRIVDRYHAFSAVIKKFRRKPPEKASDELGGVQSAATHDVSKAPIEESTSGSTSQPNGNDFRSHTVTSENTPALVHSLETAPEELVTTPEAHLTTPEHTADNVPIEHHLQVTEVRTMAAGDSELRILSADGSGIHPDWQGFINHAITTENLIDAGQPRVTSGDNVSCSSSRFFGCVFTTDSVQRAFEVPRAGNIEDSIVLGLQGPGAASNNVLAADLVSAFAIDTSNLKDPVATVVSVLSSEVGGVSRRLSVVDEDGLKNACWIRALDVNTLEISTALTWKPSTGGDVDLSSIQNSLQDTTGFFVEESKLRFSASNPPLLRLKHRAFITRDGNTFSIGSLFEVMVVLPVSGFLINLKSRTGGSLSATISRPIGNLGGSWGDLANILGGGLTEGAIDPSQAGIFNGFELWKVSIKPPGRSDFDNPGSFIIGMFVELGIPGHPLPIGLTYDTSSETFSGQLLLKSTYQDRLNTNFDELEDLPRGKWLTLPDPPDLRTAGPFSALPKFVPTRLDSAFITYRKGSDGAPYEMSFSGSLVSDSTAQNTSGKVPFPFDWSGMTLEYFRQGASSDTEDDSVETLSLNTTFELDSVSGRFESGTMDLNFTSSTGGNGTTSWALGGSVQYIQLGAIAEFINPKFKEGIFDVIGKLSLDALEVLYTWDEASTADSPAATSFLFSGTIGFGELKLRIFYQYASSDAIRTGKTAANQAKDQDSELNKNLKVLDGTEITQDDEPTWIFDAYLDAGSAGATIGMIADSIVSDASKSLPPFVRDIEVQPPAGSDNGHLISLHTGKATKKASNSNTLDEGIVFLLNVSLSSIEFSFEQLSFPGSETKRLLRVSVGKLPLLSGLPVVKELPQPWSKLQYMWIPEGGFSRNEVALLNEKLETESPDHRLFFKPATRDAADKDAPGDPTVLVQGHHFIVVVDNEAILDHVFEPDVAQGSPAPPGQESPSPPDQPATNAQEKPPAKGSMTKQLGILDVSGLSLQYKNNHVYIFVDATLKLGPMSFSLIGFGIGLNISKLKLNDLSALGDSSLTDLIDFQLHGMEVSFDNPPILISGCFYHDIIQRGDQKIEAYRGGIAIAIPPYTFVAVGEYAQVEERGVQFKSVFIFAKLDGPIIDFQFAILRGLRIGFGYNSIVRSPAVEELFDFPLISNGASEGAGNHPMAILEKMSGGENPWVQLKNDELWFAFGFTISSFNLISATAVALVQFGGAGPVFRIFGDLTISYPPDDISATAKLFYIEVVMMAELNFAEDCFKVEAALAPSSFVFVPYCRLKGGLALYSFFGRSPHAGDWVFTVGGYHRAFQVPTHYPKAARLGLDFNISIISIRGECYFAITPKAIMTGALIRCELHIGPVFAWLDAAFDAMVQFSPLHYWVSMGVEVGVECRIPLLFCTVKIRICIGARLEIEGPEFGGSAYVDFWFFSFSFDFGKRVEEPPPISLEEFYLLCEKSGPPDESPNSSPAEGLVVQLKLSLESGAFPMPSVDKEGQSNPDDAGAGAKWFVKGGNFQFRVSSVFALTEAYLETEESAQRQADGTTVLILDQDTSLMQKIDPGTAPAKLSSLPMGVSASSPPDGITSKMCVAIQDVDPKGETVENFKATFIVKEMPLTLWADPKHAPDRLTAEKGTVQLPMAVTLSAPEPILAFAKIPPFNATDMSKLCAGSNEVPDLPGIAQFILLPEVLVPSTATPRQKWAEMEQTWTAASTQNIDLANSITELCMSQLGWDKPRPDVALKAEMTSTEPWKVPVAFPMRLVAGTNREELGIEDGLDSFYLELPRITVAPVN
ncbi:hypothetical protein ONS95_003109 [Cadophora gregata]|uniref:uncharacterized protein n=1 Tax=Cadophora gregata TaxID=51156 RepID=UPI0026DC6329|nr:uncharacterized protein ONS95_003109 [Cadophora gregata]KAK0108293.1 hypothetical protein ONS95_003109 [Cadophora gregata]